MQSQNRNRRIGGLSLLLILLAAPSLLAYYVSTPFHKEYYQRFLQERVKRFGSGNYDTEYAPDLPPVSKERIVLAKGRKIFLDKSCIVFKNLKKERVEIDLYLLELDPKMPYSLTFLKKNLNKGIRLGDSKFSLISVNKKMLTLKRLESYHTP